MPYHDAAASYEGKGAPEPEEAMAEVMTEREPIVECAPMAERESVVEPGARYERAT